MITKITLMPPSNQTSIQTGTSSLEWTEWNGTVIADNTLALAPKTMPMRWTIATVLPRTSDVQIDGSLLVNTPRQLLAK